MAEITLWSNDKFKVFTPSNPHLTQKEGLHVVVRPKSKINKAWEDPELSAETFKVAAKVCQVMENLKLAPWFNIQANGNWHFLTGKEPNFHVHIYARRKGETWGLPVQLPSKPGTFQHQAMPEEDQEKISEALKEKLEK